MSGRYDVLILDTAINDTVTATLIVDVTEDLVRAAQKSWSDFINDSGVRAEHGHWDWTRKYQLTIEYELTYRMLAIEHKGEIQGLMLIAVGKDSRIASQKDKPLVYVDYLAAAPWNSKATTTEPRYKFVGKVLLQAAIELSEDEEFKGRIGLHSLPQSETWYKNCRMTDLGKDASYLNLRYFEMTPEQAKDFKENG